MFNTTKDLKLYNNSQKSMLTKKINVNTKYICKNKKLSIITYKQIKFIKQKKKYSYYQQKYKFNISQTKEFLSIINYKEILNY